MGRSAAAAGALVGASMLLGAGAGGAQSSQVPVADARFETVCTPTDPALAELSGLTAVGDRIYAVGDSGSDGAVAVLDDQCRVQRWLPVPVDPYDVEDLGSRPGGALWLADTGDNDHRRQTVALISMDPDSGAGTLHRLAYPDGVHDAEALLIQRDGTPLIVTKALFGPAAVYRPSQGRGVDELDSPGPTPLGLVGRLVPAGSAAGPLSTGMVTGAAVSADGTVAAVRTYTDVYLYHAPDGDLATALTSGAPARRVALPAQPQGEAVAFTDRGDLLVASEANDGPLPPIQVLRDAVGSVADDTVTDDVITDAAVAEQDSGTRPTWAVPAVTAAGIVVFVIGAVAVGRARRH